MGDVARVLARHNQAVLQHLMHDRLTIEACENIHLHWRNLRVEMSMSDAARLVDVLQRFSQIASVLDGHVVSMPLAAICPYDNGHRRVGDDDFDNGSDEETALHRQGIAWMIEQMRLGRRPMPIAVRPGWNNRFARLEDRQPSHIWQRLDGFKRYMAHKALGRQTIECLICIAGHPGAQGGWPGFVDDPNAWKPGFPPNMLVQILAQLSTVNEDKQRFRTNEVELLKNGIIHVHLGDVRLEFTRQEYRAFAQMIQSAAGALDEAQGATPGATGERTMVNGAALTPGVAP